MENINKVHLRGYLGGDPEIKLFENGNKLARFSLATKEEFTTRRGVKGHDVQWHYIIAWAEQANTVETYLKKGWLVEIEGRLISRNYIDKAGVKRYFTEIVVTKITPLEEPAKTTYTE